MEEEQILANTLEIENLICGLWFNPINMMTWQFSKIEPNDRNGTVLIADKSNPVRGIQLGYEIIWVNDGLTFLNLMYSSFPKTEQHQIWINDKTLKIKYITHPNPIDQYLVLNKA